jgi:glyoxylase-like metal-dependent hydrolase (beta-lactamase superfamily II)
MLRAGEIETLSPGIVFWRCYDPAVKADLFSTGLETASGIYLIDPIPLTADLMHDLATGTRTIGIIVTNENHQRAAAFFAEQMRVPVYSAVSNMPGLEQIVAVKDGHPLEPGLTAVSIEGAPAGEITLHWAANGGTLVVGDALINFEPHGFTFLPAKYCQNFARMRRSLEKLLEYEFERILFAHGTPIISGGRQRLEELLRETA